MPPNPDTLKKIKEVGTQLGGSVKIIDTHLPKIQTKHRDDIIKANDLARELVKKLGATVEPPPVKPTKPEPTKHPKWNDTKPNAKHNPVPPPINKIVFDVPKEYEYNPAKPIKPSKFTDTLAPIDLSASFLPIKNQEQTAACVGFSAASILEYLINRTKQQVNLSSELSDLFVWYLLRRNKDNNVGCFLSDIPKVKGEMRSCYEPFWSWEPVSSGIPTKFTTMPDTQAQQDAEKKKVTKVMPLPPDNPDVWVEALLKEFPVLIGMTVDAGFDNAGRDGYIAKRTNYYGARSGKEFGGHAMVIVGYTNQYPDPKDPKKSVHAFKLRNSWGSDWGENGYIWVERDILAQLLIAEPLIFTTILFDESEEKKKEPKESQNDTEEKERKDEEKEREDEENEKKQEREIKNTVDLLRKHTQGILNDIDKQKKQLTVFTQQEFIETNIDKEFERVLKEIKNKSEEFILKKKRIYEQSEQRGLAQVTSLTGEHQKQFEKLVQETKEEINKLLDEIQQNITLEKRIGTTQVRELSTLKKIKDEMAGILENMNRLQNGLTQISSGFLNNEKREFVSFIGPIQEAFEMLHKINTDFAQEDHILTQLVLLLKEREEKEGNLNRDIETKKQIVNEFDAIEHNHENAQRDDIQEQIDIIHGHIANYIESMKQADGVIVLQLRYLRPILNALVTDLKTIEDKINAVPSQRFFEKVQEWMRVFLRRERK